MKISSGSSRIVCPPAAAQLGALQRPCIAFRPKHGSAGKGRSLALRTACYDAGAAVIKKKPLAKKEKVPPLPNPQDYQQTLLRSFTLGGVGLHTGDYSFVCVRPAMAGEGRYFVRVPPGTNADNYRVEAPAHISHQQLDITSGADDGLEGDTRAQLFLKFLETQEGGYEGDFGDFLVQELGDPSDTMLIDADIQRLPEMPTARIHDEEYLPATINHAEVHKNAAIVLKGEDTHGNGGLEVLSPEALLSALEACGVDNARIEIEGGREIPVIDGSSLGWALEIQKAGLREAGSPSGEAQRVQRTAPNPQDMLTVREGDSFVSFYPGKISKVTAGIDHAAEAEVIGRQWFTWGPGDSTQGDSYEKHYRWEVAPARMVLPSTAVAEAMHSAGLLQAGVDNCCLVATGAMWLDPMLERFAMEDASRHSVATLMGYLSLAAPAGGRGMPQGHVVAYKASPKLQLKFVKALHAKAQEWGHAGVSE